jgi:hypothetical protein
MKTIALGLSVLCSVTALVWSGPAQAGQVMAGCSVVDVATFNNRVHIHCTAPFDPCSLKSGPCTPAATPPTYVAVESNAAMASTVIQLGLFALTSKHMLNIWYDDNAGANPAGCNQNDCRRIIGVVAQ